MNNIDNISSFVDYNFHPFSKIQSIKRILLIWVLSFPMCFLGKNTIVWIVIVASINIVISIFFVLLMIKYSLLKTSRFLCDGISYFYISIILNLTSYRLLTIGVDGFWYLSLIFIFLLCVSIVVFAGLVYKYIRTGKYKTNSIGKASVFPFIGAFSGILFARGFIHDVIQNSPFIVISICLLVLSFLTGICSLSLLKAICIKKYKLCNTLNMKYSSLPSNEK